MCGFNRARLYSDVSLTCALIPSRPCPTREPHFSHFIVLNGNGKEQSTSFFSRYHRPTVKKISQLFQYSHASKAESWALVSKPHTLDSLPPKCV